MAQAPGRIHRAPDLRSVSSPARSHIDLTVEVDKARTRSLAPALITHDTFGRVAWSRGAGCSDVAMLLSDATPIRIGGDLRRSCIGDRVEVLVTRRLSSFDLVSIVVPHHVEIGRVESVTAAVGDGPHSQLAAAVAARVGETLGVPTAVATVYRREDEIPAALDRLDRFGALHPTIGKLAISRPSATRLVESLDPGTLLVVGAPGGSWLQRQLFGTGHRLVVRAPGGALVVRSAPRRCFQDVTCPAGVAIGGDLMVKDALQVVRHPLVPVAHDGRLVGLVRAAALADAEPTLPVASVMEPPISVAAHEQTATIATLRQHFGDSPVPVVDSDGYLLGTIPQAPATNAKGTNAGPLS
jgi:hypothetical protein